jgi:hypothetical protein
MGNERYYIIKSFVIYIGLLWNEETRHAYKFWYRNSLESGYLEGCGDGIILLR